MKNLITKMFLVISIVIISLIFTGRSVALAEDGGIAPEFLLKYQSLPEEVEVSEGFVNNYISGFRIYVKPNNGLIFRKIAIFVDEKADPIDQRLYDASNDEYYLSSNTASVAELATLLPEGLHEIYFKYQLEEATDFINYQSIKLISDFSNPTGTLSYATQDAKTRLKLGDHIRFRFAPDGGASDIEDVSFLFNSKSYRGLLLPDGSYEYMLQVENGDIYEGGGSLSVISTDLAGNHSEYEIAADFEIDGVLPKIEISSPLSNGRYSSRNINSAYAITGEYLQSSVILRLDGEIVAGDSLIDLLDGEHIFSVQVEDAFGNIVVEESRFEIDTSYPEYSGISDVGNSPYTLGEELKIEGQTEPGARVILEIHSQIFTMEAYADSAGKFCFKIKTSNLSVGIHELYLTFYDDLGNNIRMRLGNFELVAPVAVASNKDIKVAKAEPVVVTDSVPRAPVAKVEKKQIKSEPELAKGAGAISSATDTQDSINWTLYILIFSMIVLVGALLTAGYRGFEVLFGGVVKAGPKPQPVEKYSKEEVIEDPVKLKEGPAEKPEENKKDPEVRW